jgi:hypothetical protein
MRKKILISLVTLFCCKVSIAQVRESRMQADTLNLPALYMEVDMGENDVKDAIENYFDSMHIEKEKGRGFIIKKSLPYMEFKRARVDYVQDEALDYYFQVDSKKQKGPATIYIAVSKGYNNFLSFEKDSKIWVDVKKFAEYLRSNIIEQYRITTSVASITKELEKNRKKLLDINKQKIELENNISIDSARVASLQEQLYKLKAVKN